MASMDLGKQVGPLPLGAWIVVVGAGLGIAFYTRRENNAVPVEVEDQSGVPGVGTGVVGGWVPTTPGDQPVTGVPITTNEQWAQRAINDLIAQNYPAVLADSALRNYIAGVRLSVQETALLAIALAKWGSPPQPLPPVEGGTGTPPPTGGDSDTPAAVTGLSAPRMGVYWSNQRFVQITWRAIGGLPFVNFGGYRVTVSGGGINQTHETAVNQFVMMGLKAKTRYTFTVAALSRDKSKTGGASTISVTTG